MILPILLIISDFVSFIVAAWHYVNDDTQRAIYWMLWVIAINAGWRQR